jgi:hypothetical protein
LIGLLNVDMAMLEGRMSALSAVEYPTQSLIRLFEHSEAKLNLPTLIGLKAHVQEC